MENWLTIDVIFLSYDEPNAEINYAINKKFIPHLKRVHGIKGIDTAHKACAKLSTTKNFITIDGDCVINDLYLGYKFDYLNPTKSYAFKSMNSINGLVYGNGSVKYWNKDFVLEMRSHENADEMADQQDFCWKENYIREQEILGTTFINTTPKQAWRAGFREGVKLTMHMGIPLKKHRYLETQHPSNVRLLKTWMTVGKDVENGSFAILGALEGALFNTNVNDYNYLDSLWYERMNKYKAYGNFFVENIDLLDTDIQRLTNKINMEYGLNIKQLDSAQSKMVKELVNQDLW